MYVHCIYSSESHYEENHLYNYVQVSVILISRIVKWEHQMV